MVNNYTIFDAQIGLDDWLRKPAAVESMNPGISGVSDVLPTVSLGGSALVPNLVSEPVVPTNIVAGELGSIIGHGKKTFSDTANGFLMGLDTSNGTYKWIIGGASSSVDWNVTTADTLTVKGSISASTIDIGGSDSTSFHVDIDGNLWLGAATLAAAPSSITNAGLLTTTSAVIGGWTTITGYIYDLTSGTPTSSPNNGIVMDSGNAAFLV